MSVKCCLCSKSEFLILLDILRQHNYVFECESGFRSCTIVEAQGTSLSDTTNTAFCFQFYRFLVLFHFFSSNILIRTK